MSPVLSASAFLLLAAGRCTWALNCNHFNPVYPSEHIPKFTGGPGPFGVVCEVKTGMAFPEVPSIPKDLNGEAFVVRSSYPGRFMETTMVKMNQNERESSANQDDIKPFAMTSSAKEEKCGGDMSIAKVGASMNEQVMGIKSAKVAPEEDADQSSDGKAKMWLRRVQKWLAGCLACGQSLESKELLNPGWFCQVRRHKLGIFKVPRGVWLKRLGDEHPGSSIQVGLTPGHEILGFGGAFTDAVAVANSLLSPDLQEAWLDGYFGKSGLGFTFGRVPFGGSDFSRRAYSLLDDALDPRNVDSMCLLDDREGAQCGQDAKVPIIKKALSKEPALKMFFSPWSAPAWMKTTNKLVGGKIRGIGQAPKQWNRLDKLVGGKTRGSGQWNRIDRSIADAWAKSYVKFVDLYVQEGVNFWGLTLQNEPAADQWITWNSVGLSGEDEYHLLNLVGPLMRANYPHLKIMVHDDQTYALKERLLDTGLLMSDLVDGVAYHWYGSEAGTFENDTAVRLVPGVNWEKNPAAFGGGIQVKDMFDAHIRGTEKFMLVTESCNGFVPAILQRLKDPYSLSNNRGVRPGDWYRGYRYSRDIFYQLVNGASGWVDWNLILNSGGGPNWAGNYVDAPVLVSPDGTALWVSPMYFHLAHWSKYVVPGSRVLPVDRTSSELYEVAAFLRPDHRIVIVALCDQLDGHGDPPANQVLKVSVGGLVVNLEMLSSSIVTAVFDMPASSIDPQVDQKSSGGWTTTFRLISCCCCVAFLGCIVFMVSREAQKRNQARSALGTPISESEVSAVNQQQVVELQLQ